MKKLVAMALASMMVLSAVPVMAEEAGFEETPIGEEQDIVIRLIELIYGSVARPGESEIFGISLISEVIKSLDGRKYITLK